MNTVEIVLNLLHTIWVWMTPGVHALPLAAPALTPVIATIAVVYAIKNWQLRVKVDHADQWWKRVQYALDKSLNENEKSQLIGTALIDSLMDPPAPDDSSKREFKEYRREVARLDKARWKISSTEYKTLEYLADQVTLGQLHLLTNEELKILGSTSSADTSPVDRMETGGEGDGPLATA